MTEKDAIKEAERKAIDVGGIWHVVNLLGEFYDVHEAWFKIHEGISLYQTPDYFKSPLIIRKVSLWRKVVTIFNRGLLWLFKKWVNAARNSRKT